MPGFDDKDFDPLSMNMDSIFKQFKGVNVNRVFAAAMLQKLRQMHAQVGDMLGKMTPPMYGALDPWDILGVSKEATHDEVKKAWKKKSREVHPDIGGDNQKQMMVNVAYEVICKLKGWPK